MPNYENRDLSILRAFWHSRIMSIPTQVAKSITLKSSGPAKRESFILDLEARNQVRGYGEI